MDLTSASDPGYEASYTGEFRGITAADRTIPKTTPAWLYGQPIDMARIPAQAQTPTQTGPIDDTPVAVTPPAHPARGVPHATKNADKASIPAIVATYLVRWEADLTTLGLKADETFTGAPSRVLGLA